MSFSFFSVHNEKTEPHSSTIPFLLMLIGAVIFTHILKPMSVTRKDFSGDTHLIIVLLACQLKVLKSDHNQKMEA